MYVEDTFKTPERVEVLYISPNQAAARYGLSPSVVRDFVHTADFPTILKVGRKICIPLKEFDEWMQTHFKSEQERYVPKI